MRKTTMVCSRLDDGNVELKVTLTLKNIETETLKIISAMLKDIRPVPLSYGCERIGNTNSTNCVVVLHSHTSDPGIFDAISSFARIMSTISPVEVIDACGLTKK